VFESIIKKIDKRIFVGLFLFIFIALFLIQNYLFIIRDESPIFTDWQIARSLMYYDWLVLKNKIPLYRIPYPPLTYLVTQVFFLVGGVSMTMARVSISFFAIIFLLAMYGIGYELGDHYSGAVVMALAAASPHVLNLSRLYFIEFPQTAMTALSLYYLLKTDGFRSRKYSLIFGLVLALSFFTKWSTAFFMIIPVLWFFIPIFFRKKNSLKTVLAFVLPAGVVLSGAVWYFRNIDVLTTLGKADWRPYYLIFILIPVIVSVCLLLYIERSKKGKEDYRETASYHLTNFSLMSAIFSIFTFPWYLFMAFGVKSKIGFNYAPPKFPEITREAILYFLKTIFNFYPLFILLPLIGLVLTFVFYKYRFYRRLLIPTNILLIFLFMWRMTFIDARYILSLVIFIAALGGYWINHLGRARIALTSFIVVISLCSILVWSFIPGYQGIFTPMEVEHKFYEIEKLPPVTLLCTSPPQRVKFEVGRVIDWFAPEEWERIIIFNFDKNFYFYEGRMGAGPATEFRLGSYSPHFSLAELIWLESFRRKKRIRVLLHPEMVNDFIIIHRNDQMEDVIDREISRVFPGIEFEKKIFSIGENLEITAIKLKR